MNVKHDAETDQLTTTEDGTGVSLPEPSEHVSTALRAISTLYVSSMAAAGAAFVTQVLLSRHLGPTQYGSLSAALATVTILAPLGAFGIAPYWLRVFGLEGWLAMRWLSPSLRFAALSTFATCALLALWSWVGGASESTRILAVCLTPLIIGQALNELVQARFQLEERYYALALWQGAPYIGRCLVALSMVVFGFGLGFVVAGFAVTAVVLSLISAQLLWRAAKGHLMLAGHGDDNRSEHVASPGIWAVPAGSWPFGLAALFYLIYFQSSIVLLEHLDSPHAAGIYNVAFTVMTAVFMLPSVIYQRYLLPKTHRWAEHDRDRFLAVYRFGNAWMLLLGFGIMGLLLISSSWIINCFFGAQYSQATGILILLAFTTPLRFLSTSVGGTLVTQEHMRRKVWYQAAIALVHIVLNILIIPKYSFIGAACVAILSETALLLVYLIAVRKHVFGDDAWRGWGHRMSGVRKGSKDS